MRTDTVEIYVIEGEPVCSYCSEPLGIVPDEPIRVVRGTFHPTCMEAFIMGVLRKRRR